jgi:hypothetical protein
VFRAKSREDQEVGRTDRYGTKTVLWNILSTAAGIDGRLAEDLPKIELKPHGISE